MPKHLVIAKYKDVVYFIKSEKKNKINNLELSNSIVKKHNVYSEGQKKILTDFFFAVLLKYATGT